MSTTEDELRYELEREKERGDGVVERYHALLKERHNDSETLRALRPVLSGLLDMVDAHSRMGNDLRSLVELVPERAVAAIATPEQMKHLHDQACWFADDDETEEQEEKSP